MISLLLLKLLTRHQIQTLVGFQRNQRWTDWKSKSQVSKVKSNQAANCTHQKLKQIKKNKKHVHKTMCWIRAKDQFSTEVFYDYVFSRHCCRSACWTGPLLSMWSVLITCHDVVLNWSCTGTITEDLVKSSIPVLVSTLKTTGRARRHPHQRRTAARLRDATLSLFAFSFPKIKKEIKKEPPLHAACRRWFPALEQKSQPNMCCS